MTATTLRTRLRRRFSTHRVRRSRSTPAPSCREPRCSYAIYGKLNEARDNAILACHALTGSARVADWWPDLFHDRHPLDADKHCVIGINVLGSCYGSSGPGSIDPTTGQP